VLKRRRELLDGLSNTAAGAVGSAASLILTIVIGSDCARSASTR
jgi:hypothetical protein